MKTELELIEYEIALMQELVDVLPEEDPLLDALEERIDRIMDELFTIKVEQRPKLTLVKGGK